MFDPGQEYDFVRHLGQGGMAVVELWRRRNFNQNLVVAKRVHVGDMTRAEEETARQEAKVLKKLKHPNIVGYVQSFRSGGDLIILQDYHEGGDLSDAIRRAGEARQPFPCRVVLGWLAQLAHALLYCHSTWHMLHRDLKPGNVFLSSDRESVHLGDFGVAKALGSTKAFCRTFIGTCSYMSPEVIRNTEYGLKSDVWSLGAVCYEMCTLRRPFSGGDPLRTMHLIVSPAPSPPLPQDAGYPPELGALCADMLLKSPQARPLLQELLARHSVLGEEVLGLERETGWQPSLLVPAESPPHCGSPAHGPASAASLREQMMQACISPGLGRPLTPIPASPENTACPPPPPPPPAGDPAPPAAPPLPPSDEAAPSLPPRVPRGGSSVLGAAPGGEDPRRPEGRAPADARDARHVANTVRSLLELTTRRHELVAALELLEGGDASAPSALAPAVLRLPSAQALPPPLAPPPWPHEDVAVAAPELPPEARAADARLRCMEVLQAERPDPEDLTVALRGVRELGLGAEECGQALQFHAHCLRLRAEDTVSRQDAELEEVERAAELLEAHAAAGDEPPLLRHALGVLEEARGRARMLGLRCQCEDCVRLLSVPQSAPLEEVRRAVSEAWDRPPDSLHMTWRDAARYGSADLELETEGQWRKCVDHARGTVEVQLRPLVGAEACAARRWRRRHGPRKERLPAAARGGNQPRARAARPSPPPARPGTGDRPTAEPVGARRGSTTGDRPTAEPWRR